MSFEEGNSYSAAVQIVDADGNTIAEKEIEGDPSLPDLRSLAVAFASTFVEDLNRALETVAFALTDHGNV